MLATRVPPRNIGIPNTIRPSDDDSRSSGRSPNNDDVHIVFDDELSDLGVHDDDDFSKTTTTPLVTNQKRTTIGITTKAARRQRRRRRHSSDGGSPMVKRRRRQRSNHNMDERSHRGSRQRRKADVEKLDHKMTKQTGELRSLFDKKSRADADRSQELHTLLQAQDKEIQQLKQTLENLGNQSALAESQGDDIQHLKKQMKQCIGLGRRFKQDLLEMEIKMSENSDDFQSFKSRDRRMQEVADEMMERYRFIAQQQLNNG